MPFLDHPVYMQGRISRMTLTCCAMCQVYVDVHQKFGHADEHRLTQFMFIVGSRPMQITVSCSYLFAYEHHSHN